MKNGYYKSDEDFIYFDNAATSFPKPKTVVDAIKNYLLNIGANPGRSGHKLSVTAGKKIFECRKNIAKLFGLKNPMRVIFTCNATEALNLALLGSQKKDSHVITTSMEHNSTIRLLKHLEKKGTITLTIIKGDNYGLVNKDDVLNNIKKNTTTVVANYASNVNGVVQPINKIGKICKEHGLTFIVDGAQSAGIIPIDIAKENIDLFAASGHKSLLGPTGTGLLLIADDFDFKKISPLKRGGTGSFSEKTIQPDFLPDCFESGTINVAGICGLNEGIKFLMNYKGGIKEIHNYKTKLANYFSNSAKNELKKIRFFHSADYISTGTVSFILEGIKISKVSQILSEKYNIYCREGLHCAPMAHQTLGTFPEGTIRFGFGVFNTFAQIDFAIKALKEIENL